MPRLSEHFHSDEFRCHHCGRVLGPPMSLVSALERLRAAVGRPIVVVSGYRCEVHNRAVGGATASRHLKGDAADLALGVATVAQARAAGFKGIGHKRGFAVHVDMRPGPVVTFAD